MIGQLVSPGMSQDDLGMSAAGMSTETHPQRAQKHLLNVYSVLHCITAKTLIDHMKKKL